MPYTQKFHNVLEARAHGDSLNNPKLDKITPEKAKAMLNEASGSAVKKLLKARKKTS